jgi:hypothetical protein
MTLLKRFALAVSIVFGSSLVLAVAGFAAIGGLTPGDYVFTNIGASATIGAAKGGPPDQPVMDIFVNRGLNSFRPRDHDGTRTVTNSTMVQLNIFSASGGAFGCFVITPSDFTVNKNLQSASLHTTLTTDKACPGVGAPVTGKSDVVPLAAGGGTLPLPITLDVKWTGLGATSTGHDHSTFECLKYSTQLTNTSHGTIAKASGTVSVVSGSFATDLASVSSNDTHLNIRGTQAPACLGI